MTEGSSKAKEIALGDKLGDIAVKANGVRVEIHTDGSIVAYTRKDVDAYTDGAVHVHPAVNDDHKPAGEAAPKIGDVMPAGHKQAGWIYMGPDDETGEVFYAAPKDESGTFTFNKAAKRAESIGAQVPTKSQLDKMYRNKDKGALKGTFNETGSYPAGWYWSSSQLYNFNAWAQRFSDGGQLDYGKLHVSSLRCVR